MWCSRCRQDVPAIAAPFEQTLCCARCRHPLNKPDDAPRAVDANASAQSSPGPQSVADDLELLSPEQQAELDTILSRAEWLLGIDGTQSNRPAPRRDGGTFHPAHQRLSGHHVGHRRRATLPRRSSRMTLASWCALAVAMTGFVCGGILLGWSLIGNRPELWNVGETVTLASQVGLLIGLILQLERLGHDRHQTVNRLTLLDKRVESLRNSSAAWSDGRSAATDASPNLAPESLLADLKCQLDSLANRLGEKRSA